MIFVPSGGVESWQTLLADSKRHWKSGCSAQTLASSWEDAGSFPSEILDVLHQQPSLSGIEPLLIFPEWKVTLPGGGTPSQNDVWVLAKCDEGMVSISVEGKVKESFGETVGKWRANASKGKIDRLAYLVDILGLQESLPDTIYYQLLHRAASAVIEAERFGALQSVMLVHSFSLKNCGFEAFRDFAALFGVSAEIGKLFTVKRGNNTPLHLAWVHGDERFLNRPDV